MTEVLLKRKHNVQMSRLMTKPTKWHVRPAKTQISLGIRHFVGFVMFGLKSSFPSFLAILVDIYIQGLVKRW